jgi:hypothetical protein
MTLVDELGLPQFMESKEGGLMRKMRNDIVLGVRRKEEQRRRHDSGGDWEA